MENIGNLVRQLESKVKVDVNAPAYESQTYCAPNCDICGGVGLVRYDVATTDPRFGKLFPCPNLPLVSPIYNECGLTVQERSLAWNVIKGRKDEAANDTLHEAVAAVKAVMAKGSGMVILYGGNGLAKSLILKIAVAETLRARRGVMARYVLMPDIVEDLRSSFDADRPGQSLKEATNRYYTYPVLAIDELGVERDTPFAAEKQFIVLDHRYNAAIENGEPLVTLLATNLSINDFPARIKDRLSDGRCHAVKLVGESLRPGKK